MPFDHPLPAEIWLAILRHATSVSHLLDTSPPDPFSYSIAHRPDVIQRRVLRSMPTRRSIIQVCRFWYALARPFLYEAIVIRRPISLRKLVRMRNLSVPHKEYVGIIEEGRRPSSLHWLSRLDPDKGEGLDFLQYVRRLDFKIDYSEAGNCDFIIPLLHLLLRRATKLEILIIHLSYSSYYFEPQLVDFPIPLPIASRCLRALEITSSMPHPEISQAMFFAMLRLQPLQFLKIKLADSTHYSQSFQIQYESALPEVNWLHIPNKILVSLPNHCPNNITHLTISHSHLARYKIAEKIALLGSTLQLLDLPNDILWGYGPNPPQTMTLLRDIAVWCPNLHDLIISFRGDEVAHLQYLDFLPPVKNLGLRMNNEKGLTALIWQAVINDIPKLLQATPTIRVVRVLSKPSFLRQIRNQRLRSYVEMTHTVPEACWRIIKDHSVRVEDYAGRLMVFNPD